MLLRVACPPRLGTRILPVLRAAASRTTSTGPVKHPLRPTHPSKSSKNASIPSITKAGASATLPSGLTVPQRAQYSRAAKLLEDGPVRLYAAPRDLSFILGSWTIAGMAFGAFYWIYNLGHYQDDDPTGVPALVKYTHRLLMPIFCGLGWWLILRTGPRVRTVDLKTRNSIPYLQVGLRRRFLLPYKRKQISAELTNFLLPREMVAVPEIPRWADRGTSESKPGIGKRISMATYSFFFGTRKIFSGQGVFDAKIKGHGTYKMDISGEFHNHGRSLLGVVSMDD